MTKKDYELIARAFYNQMTSTTVFGTSEQLAIKGTAMLLSVYLAEQNPKFNRSKFLMDCGHDKQELRAWLLDNGYKTIKPTHLDNVYLIKK